MRHPGVIFFLHSWEDEWFGVGVNKRPGVHCPASLAFQADRQHTVITHVVHSHLTVCVVSPCRIRHNDDVQVSSGEYSGACRYTTRAS